MAASLAAATSSVFMHFRFFHWGAWSWALVAGIPTFVVGFVWAIMLRWPRSTRGGVRWGWLASIPLAACNGALAGGAFLATSPSTWDEGSNGTFFGGAVLGCTFGCIYWAPALLLVLLIYGVPIASAQKLAERGIGGEERGERIVGVTSCVVGLSALAIAHAIRGGAEGLPSAWLHTETLGWLVIHGFGILALATGVLAIARATVREASRARFVERVQAGKEPAFRVEATPHGKALVRIGAQATYRLSEAPGERLGYF